MEGGEGEEEGGGAGAEGGGGIRGVLLLFFAHASAVRFCSLA